MNNYDINSPIQDADIEMNDLQISANRESKLRKMGICCHGWTKSNPFEGTCKCLDCGKEFKSEVEYWEERRERLS